MTEDGNADVMIVDGTHPTGLGHKTLGDEGVSAVTAKVLQST